MSVTCYCEACRRQIVVRMRVHEGGWEGYQQIVRAHGRRSPACAVHYGVSRVRLGPKLKRKVRHVD